MKNISKLGLYGVAAGLAAFIVGCGTAMGVTAWKLISGN